VRKLVGSLSHRVALWRSAVGAEHGWSETARESVYKDEIAPDALGHSSAALQRLWTAIGTAGLDALIDGRLE
jgi:hypothetical protein